jgi:hypothetical protein
MTYSRHQDSRPSKVRDYVAGYLNEAGDVVTYEELAVIIDITYPTGDDHLDHEAITAISKAVARANKYLSDDGNWKHLVVIPNVGYRVATPSDLRNEALGRSRHILKEQRRVITATEKVTIHPDATANQRTQANNNLSLQHSVRMMLDKARRKTRREWTAPEEPTVVEE